MNTNISDIAFLFNGKKRPISGELYPVFGGNGIVDYSDESNAKDCVIIGRVGAYCGSVYRSEGPCWITDNAIGVQAKDKVNIDFLYYLLCSLHLNRKQIGAAQPLLTQKIISEICVSIPELSVQEKIASILCSLDQKIQVNRRINDNLSRVAQSLYKYHFVDFEPYCNFGLIDSEIGFIPKGWQIRYLREFFPVITGKMNANVSADVGKYPFFSCSQTINWTDQYSFDAAAILVAGNGDFNVKWYKGKFEAYQRTYVLIPHNPELLAWLYYSIEFHLNKITMGARGSVIKFITKGQLENLPLALPPNFEKLPIVTELDNINQQIAKNVEENRKLSELRDTLLVYLLSNK